MGYLIDIVMRKRFDSEAEAKRFIEQMNHGTSYEVVKHSVDKKERKQKGEIVDTWYLTTLKLKFNDEKEPDFDINVSFNGETNDWTTEEE